MRPLTPDRKNRNGHPIIAADSSIATTLRDQRADRSSVTMTQAVEGGNIAESVAPLTLQREQHSFMSASSVSGPKGSMARWTPEETLTLCRRTVHITLPALSPRP